METRQIHVRDLSTVTGIQQYEHCVQSIFFLGLEDFEGTIYLSIESDKFSEDVALTNNTFIIGQPMTKFNVTYTCQIYGIVGTGEKIQLSKQFRMVIYKSNNISGEAGEYPIDPNIVNGIDQYITTKESEIDDYVEQVIESIPSDYTALEQATYNAYPTESESGNPIYFDDGAKDIPVKELIVNLEPKQSGSGDPSPTNVRPISGYDGVNILRTGKNIVTATRSTFTEHGITVTKNFDGVYTLNGTATEDGDLNLFPDGITNPIKKGSYIASGISDGSANTYRLGFRLNDSENNLQYVLFYNSDTAFEVDEDKYVDRIYVFVKSGTTLTNLSVKPMIRVSGASATYSAPRARTNYSITFPSEVGTVYGGSLNVTTGVLTVDRAIATITDVSQMAKGGATNVDEFYMRSPSPWGQTGTLYGADNIVCSHATSLASGSTTQIFTRLGVGQPRIVFPLSEGINSLSAFETWLNGQTNPLQFAYRIAEPLTYQLTPTEVSTLFMGNTFMSDGSMELTYRADTTMVIEKLTNAIVSLGGNV